ncbi:hypothetical protein GCM10023350_19760 [Nocardioides endophyticus]|uniref:Uncharacterized protein n=1 Tax=Nocardioides endophyticus TaxID=1353775 RepID=A0ABP8YRG3_9ACTN
MAGPRRKGSRSPVQEIGTAAAQFRERFGFDALHVDEREAVLQGDQARVRRGRPPT